MRSRLIRLQTFTHKHARLISKLDPLSINADYRSNALPSTMLASTADGRTVLLRSVMLSVGNVCYHDDLNNDASEKNMELVGWRHNTTQSVCQSVSRSVPRPVAAVWGCNCDNWLLQAAPTAASLRYIARPSPTRDAPIVNLLNV